MAIIRKISEPVEPSWQDSPVMQRLIALDKKRCDRMMKARKERMKNTKKAS